MIGILRFCGFCIASIFVLLLISNLQSNVNTYTIPIVSNIENFVDSNVRLAKFDRFIMPTYGACSGIGNQMFRVASLYGIGKYFRRTPALDGTKKCQRDYMKEIKTTFPNFFDLVSLEIPHPNDTAKSEFGLDCCTYQDPKTMHDTNATWLVLRGNYFQTYKFFHEYKNEIVKLFEFSDGVKANATKYADELFKDDKSHKTCIHVRRGDFIKHENLETRPDFLLPAMTLVTNHLRANRSVSDISLVFIGIEGPYLASLNFTRSNYNKIYRASLKSRGEDMYFGVKYCDSILLSASASTFGWWIAYLASPTVPVFYNGQVGKDRNKYPKDHRDFDQFPPEWQKLELINGTVSFNDQWYYERFGMPRKPLAPLFY
uniref:L-Fucosyltransferase n=1 Tax=Panagrellus redivivus TaxID=6233 RepID=A0A7E4UVL9_PANRE